MPVCIVAFVGGNCATATPTTLLNKKYDKTNKAQQWTIEREGDSMRLAFKSEMDGQYIRATVGQAYGLITTGSKQWWIAEPGSAPGSFWLKCADFPDAYFANASASMADGNKIYCWPKQQGWAHALQWYFHDAAGDGVVPSSSLSGPKAQAAAAQLEERDKALAEREQAMKLKEAELAKRETQALQGKTDSKPQGNQSKAMEEQLASLQKTLQAREKVLVDLEAKIKAKETAAVVINAGDNASQGDTEKAQEIDRLRRELVETKSALAQAGKPIAQPWVANAVHKPERKLPPIVRPARKLPRGFDTTLIVRATGPASRVVELES